MGRPGPNVIKICKICGKEFHPTSSRQVNCNRPTDIITTSDRAYASSKLYYTLGFKEVSINDEQGVWIRNSDNQVIDASEVTQQMIDLHRCVQVFDSGTITWQWTYDSL